MHPNQTLLAFLCLEILIYISMLAIANIEGQLRTPFTIRPGVALTIFSCLLSGSLLGVSISYLILSVIPPA